MSILILIKRKLTTLPFPIGKAVSLIPYANRPGLGALYRKRQEEIEHLADGGKSSSETFVYNRVKSIATYAAKTIPFYRELYSASSVRPERFHRFEDLKELPVITKSDLQKVPLEFRSVSGRTRELVNTGGSSGNPLELYIEPNSIPHEWAHMHAAWKKVGFQQGELRIVFSGRSNINSIVQYDSARHQLNVDIYSGWSKVADKLLSVFNRYKPSYLHGYPSSIFDFVLWLEERGHPLLAVFRNEIKGLLLGSELPSPEIRRRVEMVLGCGSVSWYGHTERAVLAYEETEYGIYNPFMTYGYAEAVSGWDGHRLVGTSYHNLVSPLIRYDTGDLIEPNIHEGLLKAFSIKQGREGEFILDRLGNKIFLTGLIFGRHHGLFERARHVQIRQITPGQAEVLIVPRGEMTPSDASFLFDSSNVEIDLFFKIIDEPVRTQAGKVPLLVKGLI